MKKKGKVEEFEYTIMQLTQENEELKRENAELRTQLAAYKFKEKSLPVINTQINNNTYIASPAKTPLGAKGIGACLLIMIFSFALVFNPNFEEQPFRTSNQRFNRALLNVEEESWYRLLANLVLNTKSLIITSTTTTTTIIEGLDEPLTDETTATTTTTVPTTSSIEEPTPIKERHTTDITDRCNSKHLSEEERNLCLAELSREALKYVTEETITAA